MSKDTFWKDLKDCFEDEAVVLATLSSPLDKKGIKKIAIRSLKIKDKSFYQVTEWHQNQTFHRNLNPQECYLFLENTLSHYKQTLLYTNKADFHVLVSKKGSFTVMRKAPSKIKNTLPHNRQKDYFLEEGDPIPFLVRLGVMDSKGRVLPKMAHKFRQINRFIEMIADIMPHFDRSRRLQIVDFGCGKAYLTFALYHYLKVKEGLDIFIYGLDLKEKVIQECQQLADDLHYENLQFSLGDIKHYQTEEPVDMVISLHACDTATDAALAKAMTWKSQIILCVPCCQHELFNQVSNKSLEPLLKHGILKERFAALATDAIRAQKLEIEGYQTQVMEFIDLEHTPKNLLIRAIKRARPVQNPELERSYEAFKEFLNVHPSLDQQFPPK